MVTKKVGIAILFCVLIGTIGTIGMTSVDRDKNIMPDANSQGWFELRYSVIQETEMKIADLNSDMMRFTSENGPVSTWNAEQFNEYDLIQKNRNNHIDVYYDLVAEYNNASNSADAEIFSNNLPGHIDDRMWD